LYGHFSKYGEIIEAVVMKDRHTGRPRGFGFVTFVEPGLADRIQEEKHVIDGRQIDAKKSVPQESKAKARKIFVGGLSPETSEEALKDHFSKFGEVAEVQVMQDHMSGRSRGFGFVTFIEDGSAMAAYEAGTMHEVGGKQVEVKPATPKGTGPTGGSVAGVGGLRDREMMAQVTGMVPQRYPRMYQGYGGGMVPSSGSMGQGRGTGLLDPRSSAAAPFGPMSPPSHPHAPYMYPGIYPPYAGGAPYMMPGGHYPTSSYPPNPYHQPNHGYGGPSSPNMMPRQGGIMGGGRGNSKGGRVKVDSASSLDQQQYQGTESRLKHLSLE
jgi:heterogeneous nuclear ribonucleoprotein A1/A3